MQAAAAGAGAGLAADAVRVSRAESVRGSAYAPAQRIKQNYPYQGDHGYRDRRREAENHDR